MEKILVLSFLLASLFTRGQGDKDKGIEPLALTKSQVHIVTSYMPSKLKKYKFSINGESFQLKGGQCMEHLVSGDSVEIIFNNRPLFKAQYPINLHVAAKEHIYVSITWGEQVGKSALGHMAAKEICEACYLDIKKNCGK